MVPKSRSGSPEQRFPELTAPSPGRNVPAICVCEHAREEVVEVELIVGALMAVMDDVEPDVERTDFDEVLAARCASL